MASNQSTTTRWGDVPEPLPDVLGYLVESRVKMQIKLETGLITEAESNRQWFWHVQMARVINGMDFVEDCRFFEFE